jgi:Putative sensor
MTEPTHPNLCPPPIASDGRRGPMAAESLVPGGPLTATTTIKCPTTQSAGDDSLIPAFRNPLRLVLSASPWRSARYLAAHLICGTILGAAAALVAAAGATAAATVAGLPLLRPAARVIRRCADAEGRRLRLIWPDPVRAACSATDDTCTLAGVLGPWRDPLVWRDLCYLVGLWLPLALLDVAVLSVWATLLTGVTLPFWYWAPRGTDLIGYVHGSIVHGAALGYFPHGPAGSGAVGLYADTLPKAMLAAAIFGLLFLLFNYVLVKAALTHAVIARAWLARLAVRQPGSS